MMNQNLIIINIFFVVILLDSYCSVAQENYVTLKQGTVAGLKIFPETSRTPVYAFLGIPYAQPPIGNLRFAPPVPYNGWNQTSIYYAKSFKPICPQLTNSIYDETSDRLLRQISRMDEDCLYLNIWTPENGLRYGNLPVLVIITGEEMSFDWPQNHPSGLDLASEGCIVVTIQYRMNIFGWLITIPSNNKLSSTKSSSSSSFSSSSSSSKSSTLIGNYGLRDQELALIWIQQNIHKFGGNPEQITLLGHGTSGSICALLHLLNLKNSENLFSKLILMSPNGKLLNDISTTTTTSITNLQNDENNDDNDNLQNQILISSEKIIQKLGCQFFNIEEMSNCLRSKSVGDLLKAFEVIYKNGNYTTILGPVYDNFLNNNQEDQQQNFFIDDPLKTLLLGNYRKIPIMTGICTNEGAFIRDYWIDLAREGIKSLKMYINYTIIPLILSKYNFLNNNMNNNYNSSLLQIYKTIIWRYFEQESKSPLYMLGSMQRLISEAEYESPFYNIIELIARSLTKQNHNNDSIRITSRNNHSSKNSNTNNFYVYAFHNTNSMDMRGKINLYGGASHSSDLPLLMGPSLFQQIARRRLTQTENKLCRKLRQYFTDFIKTGNPTPGRIYDGWLSYTTDRKFIKILGDSPNFLKSESMIQFEHNLPAIEEMLQKSAGSGTAITNHHHYQQQQNHEQFNPYYLNSKEITSSIESRHGKSSYFAINRQDYEYFQYLKIVYSFWNVLLPSIYKTKDEPKIDNSSTERAGREIQFYENDSVKYKHAFFSMLALVCFLLGILVSSLRNQITSSTLTTTAIPNEPKTLTTKCIFTKEKRWRKSKQKSKGKNIQKSETFDSISYDFDDDDTMKVKNWRYHLTNEHL